VKGHPGKRTSGRLEGRIIIIVNVRKLVKVHPRMTHGPQPDGEILLK
jgi:hypothetical protein